MTSLFEPNSPGEHPREVVGGGMGTSPNCPTEHSTVALRNRIRFSSVHGRSALRGDQRNATGSRACRTLKKAAARPKNGRLPRKNAVAFEGVVTTPLKPRC